MAASMAQSINGIISPAAWQHGGISEAKYIIGGMSKMPGAAALTSSVMPYGENIARRRRHQRIAKMWRICS